MHSGEFHLRSFPGITCQVGKYLHVGCKLPQEGGAGAKGFPYRLQRSFVIGSTQAAQDVVQLN